MRQDLSNKFQNVIGQVSLPTSPDQAEIISTKGVNFMPTGTLEDVLNNSL